MKKLLILFFEMFKTALFVIGGGYAIIAVLDEVFSKKYRWTNEGELADQLSLFQMVPGIMAGHAAVYVGRKVAGLAGSAVALAGVALPSIIVFSLVSKGYDSIPLDNPVLTSAFEGLRASLTGVIVAMLVRNWKKSPLKLKGAAGLLVSSIALFSGVNVLLIVLFAVFIGVSRVAVTRIAKRKTFFSISPAPLLFLRYGLIAFGGGYVLVPLYLRDFVGPDAAHLQIPSEEFANLIALTQMTPGPIGINAATFFGYRMFGIAGAVATSLCLLIPGFVILSCALASLERFKENEYLKSILASLRPVTLSMMVVASVSFAGMSLWTHCAESFAIHPLAIILALATVIAMLRKYFGAVRAIFLSAFISILVNACLTCQQVGG